MIYLDYTATTPLNPEVTKTYTKLLNELFANPDSIHKLGLETESLMNKSRQLIADMLHVKYDEVLFTSGASEANNMAIKGVAFQYANRGKHIITSTCEHSSVYETCHQLEKVFGYEITYINVDSYGKLDLEQLNQAIRKDTILVSIMHINNEVGFINPVDQIVKIVREKNPLTKIHIDMVQSLGKVPIDLSQIDLASFSAHKIYGLKGSGILMKKNSCQIVPLISGGQQEFNLRAGTSNVLTNIVLAKTMRLALENLNDKLMKVKQMNHYLRERLILNEGVVINTPLTNGSPYIINVSFVGYKPEVFVHELEKYEIYVSTRSACSTKSNQMSRTLEMMKVDPAIGSSAIRISLSALTSQQELDTFINAVQETMKNLKKQR
ncbi:cysteine desulfurase family protein [Beduini massiliensis]|uniref:cysteine desulfurase family protein n=1 Tax=Beduini massiliensis TaxID=1585974 RepID=UPI00059A7C2A|nr:cysteine desulfurase family protein [Beduini massiliensis]